MTEPYDSDVFDRLTFTKSHAFIIGINEYQNYAKLKTAVNDAKKVAEVLKEKQKFDVQLLLDATYCEIKELLEKTIIERVEPEDRVFFYFAGHGVATDGDRHPGGYIIPADAQRGSSKSNNRISMKMLHDSLDRLPCRHLLLILDCCFAGTFKWSSRFRDAGPDMPEKIYQEHFDRYIRDNAWQVIASSAYDQKALDIIDERTIGKRVEYSEHSPFAEALFRGLEGEADIIPAGKGDGIITATELYLYIRQQVEPKTIEKNEWLRQTPLIFQLEKHDKGEFIFLDSKHPLVLQPIPNIKPFKGLESFEEGDADLFFGRTGVIKEIKKKLTTNNLVIVTGASGTGKSSVVKAGLIPALRKQDYRILPIIRPGQAPKMELLNTLYQSNQIEVTSVLEKDIAAIPANIFTAQTLLVIDQSEELVTISKKEKRKEFFKILEYLLDNNKDNRLKIILTVRADFEPHLKCKELEQYWNNETRYIIPSLSPGELREIIVKPAIQAAFFFEPKGFVDKIMDEVMQAINALPLLSFTLRELYESYKNNGRTDRTLQQNDYDTMGGVAGALNKRAQDIYDALNPDEKGILQKIILRMLSFEGNEIAGKKVAVDELIFTEKENSKEKSILEQFIKARLLHINNEYIDNEHNEQKAYLRPAHDELIRSWTILNKWIEDHNKENLISLPHLSEDVRVYSNATEKKSQLLWDNNARLPLFKDELTKPNSLLNLNERNFIEKSLKLKKQKNRRFALSLFGIIIILTGLSFYALYNARIAQSNYRATQAQLTLKKNPTQALRLAEEACRLNKNNDVAMRILVDASATALEQPFYTATMQHEAQVNDAVFSPDGETILTASNDKTVVLWDLKGNRLTTIPHNATVFTARFSSDGRQILTVSKENHAQLWDLRGTRLQTFRHNREVTTAEFSTDGNMIVTASNDRIARVWDTEGNLLKAIPHKEGIITAAFSPDNTRILTITNNRIASLYNLQDYKVNRFKDILTANFAPKDHYLLFVCVNKTVELRNWEGKRLRLFKRQNQPVKYTDFSEDGNQILIVYTNGTIEVSNWLENTRKEFDTHENNVFSATFSPDGTKILTASRDKTAKLWHSNGVLHQTLEAHTDMVTSARFSPDGTKILTVSHDKTAKLWDLKKQPVINFKGHTDKVFIAGFSPDGTHVLTVSDDKTARVWNNRGEPKAILDKHKNIINTAHFSPDRNKILTASADGTAGLWDMDGNSICQLKGHKANVNSAVFSPNGHLILTASYDNTAKLWDLEGNQQCEFNTHSEYVNFADFSPNGKNILTTSYDGTAKLWTLRGKLIQNFLLPKQVEYARFSPDSTKILFIFTSSRVAELRNIDGRPLIEFNKHNESITSAAFSPKGTKILTASNDKTAKLWDLDGNILTDFTGHSGIIYTAVFSPGGTHIVTASTDNTVKIWDMSGNILSDFKIHSGIVYTAIFSPDGSKILSASADGTAKLWYTPEKIIQWLKTAQIPKLIHWN
jgi:WD40 repeat protein